MPMARDQIVDRIAGEPRHERTEGADPPDATQVAGNAERRGRSDEHALANASRVVDPDHRVGGGSRGMARTHLPADLAVQRREPEQRLALVPQHELYAGGAEAAFAVVEQQRRASA